MGRAALDSERDYRRKIADSDPAYWPFADRVVSASQTVNQGELGRLGFRWLPNQDRQNTSNMV